MPDVSVSLLEKAAIFAAAQERPHFSVKIELRSNGFCVEASDSTTDTYRRYRKVVSYSEAANAYTNCLCLAVAECVKRLDRAVVELPEATT